MKLISQGLSKRRELFSKLEMFCVVQLDPRHINAGDEMFLTYKLCKQELKNEYSISNKEFNFLKKFVSNHLKLHHEGFIEKYFRDKYIINQS